MATWNREAAGRLAVSCRRRATTRNKPPTYILNHLIEAGAIRADADGRFTIDPARAGAEGTRAAGEFVSLMAKGDLVAIEALLGRYVTVRPEVEAALKRLGTDPPPQRMV